MLNAIKPPPKPTAAPTIMSLELRRFDSDSLVVCEGCVSLIVMVLAAAVVVKFPTPAIVELFTPAIVGAIPEDEATALEETTDLSSSSNSV